MEVIRDPSLVFDLPLYELDGDTSVYSKDQYGHICTKSDYPDPGWTPKGFTFDGVNDTLNCGLNGSLKLTDGTLEIWLKGPTDADHQGVIATADAAGENGYRIGLVATTAVPQLILGDTVAFDLLTGTTRIDDNIWHHIVATFGHVMNLYVDGEIDQPTPVTRVKTMTYSNNLILGAWSDLTKPYIGTMGEVRIYNRPLLLEEVRNNRLATQWRYK